MTITTNISNNHNPAGQRGFTMMEALVAILILSLGLLGLAMLQAQGLKFNTTAYTRTQASMLAYEIIDKMRMSTNPSEYVMTSEPSATGCNAFSISAECAQEYWWNTIIDTLGNEANGTIVNPSTNIFTVTINWVDRPVRIEYDPDNPPGFEGVAGIPRNVAMSIEL